MEEARINVSATLHAYPEQIDFYPTSRKDGRVRVRPAGSPFAYDTAILLVSSSGLRCWDIGKLEAFVYIQMSDPQRNGANLGPQAKSEPSNPRKPEKLANVQIGHRPR